MGSAASFLSALESSLQGSHYASPSNSGNLWGVVSWPLLLCHPVPVSGILLWAHFSSFSCYPLLSQGANPIGYIAQAPRSAGICPDSANGRVDRRLKVASGIAGNPGVSSVAPKPLEGCSMVPGPCTPRTPPLSFVSPSQS